MGAIKGFMEYGRETPSGRPVEERLNDQKECYAPFLRKSISNREPDVWTVVFPFARVNQAVRWET